MSSCQSLCCSDIIVDNLFICICSALEDVQVWPEFASVVPLIKKKCSYFANYKIIKKLENYFMKNIHLFVCFELLLSNLIPHHLPYVETPWRASPSAAQILILKAARRETHHLLLFLLSSAGSSVEPLNVFQAAEQQLLTNSIRTFMPLIWG